MKISFHFWHYLVRIERRMNEDEWETSSSSCVDVDFLHWRRNEMKSHELQQDEDKQWGLLSRPSFTCYSLIISFTIWISSEIRFNEIFVLAISFVSSLSLIQLPVTSARVLNRCQTRRGRRKEERRTSSSLFMTYPFKWVEGSRGGNEEENFPFRLRKLRS